jgi:hypothetical protein
MTKKLLVLAAIGLALAPAALAGNGNGQTAAGAGPSLTGQGGQQTAPQQPAQGSQSGQKKQDGGGPLRRLRLAVASLQECAGQAQQSADCTALAGKVDTSATKFDAKVQKRIDALQTACTAGSTDPRCPNADKRIARLQKIDAWLQGIATKLQPLSPTAAGG